MVRIAMEISTTIFDTTVVPGTHIKNSVITILQEIGAVFFLVNSRSTLVSELLSPRSLRQRKFFRHLCSEALFPTAFSSFILFTKKQSLP